MYIEAAYHISDPAMVAERAALLLQTGVIYQQPYIESTPRYMLGYNLEKKHRVDPVVAGFLTGLSEPVNGARLAFHNPPYQHQAAALEEGGRQAQESDV